MSGHLVDFRKTLAWRSPIDLPRDGTPIVLLFWDYTRGGRRSKPAILRCEALMLGVSGEPGSEVEDWYCAMAWDQPYDAAAQIDKHIIGWFPLPYTASWDEADE